MAHCPYYRTAKRWYQNHEAGIICTNLTVHIRESAKRLRSFEILYESVIYNVNSLWHGYKSTSDNVSSVLNIEYIWQKSQQSTATLYSQWHRDKHTSLNTAIAQAHPQWILLLVTTLYSSIILYEIIQGTHNGTNNGTYNYYTKH